MVEGMMNVLVKSLEELLYAVEDLNSDECKWDYRRLGMDFNEYTESYLSEILYTNRDALKNTLVKMQEQGFVKINYKRDVVEETYLSRIEQNVEQILGLIKELNEFKKQRPDESEGISEELKFLNKEWKLYMGKMYTDHLQFGLEYEKRVFGDCE